MNVPHSSLELSHFPVMLDEVIKICSPEKGGNFVDCTFGGGGYSKELLKFPNTKVTAIDRDESTITYKRFIRICEDILSKYGIEYKKIESQIK